MNIQIPISGVMYENPDGSKQIPPFSKIPRIYA